LDTFEWSKIPSHATVPLKRGGGRGDEEGEDSEDERKGRTEAKKKELVFKSRKELEQDIRSVRDRGLNLLKPKI
jgi:hypothetical protein